MKRKTRVRKRKCLGCGELFVPDPRQKGRQNFCSKLECRCASKAHSQQKWLRKPKNKTYFSGSEHVMRVQVWRKENPGYSKRDRLRKKALQDTCGPQPVTPQVDATSLAQDALQDTCLSQPSLVVGLIASLSGLTLQDEIAVYIREVQSHGQRILRRVPNAKPGDKYEDQKTIITPRAGASSA